MGGVLAWVARPGGRHHVRRAVLPHLDCRHKAIALAVQRAHETRGPPPLSKRLAQRRDTGFQDFVPDKLVGPQVLEEFVLGHHPIAMGQEVGEDLQHFAPHLERRASAMQLSALGIQDIVAKEVAHRPASLSPAEPLQSQLPVGGNSPQVSHALLWEITMVHLSTKIIQKCSENVPKIFRTYHVCRPGEPYHSAMHAAGDAVRTSWGDTAARCPPAMHSDLIVRGRWLVPHHERRKHAIRQALTGSGQQQTGGRSLAPRRPPPRPMMVAVMTKAISSKENPDSR